MGIYSGRVLHELWEDPEDDSLSFGLATGAPPAHLSSSARLVWTVEAASHGEAMTRYYAHQGWAPYKPDPAWGDDVVEPYPPDPA